MVGRVMPVRNHLLQVQVCTHTHTQKGMHTRRIARRAFLVRRTRGVIGRSYLHSVFVLCTVYTLQKADSELAVDILDKSDCIFSVTMFDVRSR